MPKRIALLTTLILSLVLLPGCPGGVPSALVGTWTVTTNTIDYGLVLQADGTATSFVIDNDLVGAFTWEENGTEFLMRQVQDDGDHIFYIGRINSDTTMSGAWILWEGPGEGASNLWNAVKQ